MFKFKTDDANNGGSKMTKDARLIDFQFSNWSSPATDLHYLINTSFANELRLNRQDELIKYYHEMLASTLTKLDYGGHVPALHELCVQMEDRRFYAKVLLAIVAFFATLTSSIVNHPLQSSENTEDSDLTRLIQLNERSSVIIQKQKKTQENAIALLPFFDRRGLLDVVD